MLTLQPGLMRAMDTDHLVRSLECEPTIMRTPVELELMRKCYDLADERDERIEADTIQAHIDEAIAQYPEEDFLEKLADRVFELGEKLRGDNKIEAHTIAKELTELGQTISNAAAFGADELRKIFKE